MNSYAIIIVLTSIVCCLASAILAFTLKRSNSSKDKLLVRMQTTMDILDENCPNLEVPAETAQTPGLFDDTLRTAALTTRIQQPRLNAQQNGYSPATPERYRYIQTLVAKGVEADEIAATFSLSLQEATQLVTLIKLARRHQHAETALQPVRHDAVTPEPVPVSEIDTSPLEDIHHPSAPKPGRIFKKSTKLGRWINKHASAPNLRRRTGSREPPLTPLPDMTGRSSHPLPGYT